MLHMGERPALVEDRFESEGLRAVPQQPDALLFRPDDERIAADIHDHAVDLVAAQPFRPERLIPGPFPVAVPVEACMARGNPHLLVPAHQIVDAEILQELLVPDRLVPGAVRDLQSVRIPDPEPAEVIVLNGEDHAVDRSCRVIQRDSTDIHPGGMPCAVLIIDGKTAVGGEDRLPLHAVGHVFDACRRDRHPGMRRKDVHLR